MTIYLKQSTASQEILLGPFLSSTDGTTAKTGLTIANTDIKIWKAGGTTVGDKNSGGATEISAGYYYATLDATDTGTAGPLIITVNVATALMIRLECAVLTANAWDNMFGTGALLSDILTDTAVIGAAGAGLTAIPWNAAWDAEVQSECQDAITASSLPTAATVADAVWDEASTGHTDAGKAGAQMWTDIDAILEDTSTTLDDLIDTEIATIVSELAKVPKSDSNVTWNATALASINAEVDTALNTAIPGSPTANSINERIAAIDDLTQASGAGDLAAILTDTSTTLDGIVDAILADTNELQTDWHDGGRLDLILDAASAPSAATVADAVWDEVLSGHTGSGSTGEALTAAGGSGDPWITALPGSYSAGQAGKIIGDYLNAPVATIDTVVDGIATELAKVPKSDGSVTWNDTAMSDIQETVADALDGYDAAKATEVATAAQVKTAIEAAGSHLALILEDTGTTLPATLTTIDDFLDTEIAAILADTNELQTDLVNGGRLDLLIDAIKAKTDNLPTDPADQSAVEAAITSAHATTDGKIDAVDNYVDTEVAAILTAVDTEVAAIKTVTDAIGATGTGLSAIPWNAAWDTEVQSECTDALNAYDPPTNTEMEARTLVAASYATATALATVDGIVDDILVDTGTTLDGKINTMTTRVYPNFKITSPVFSVTGKMTSCTVTRYPTKADADAGTNGIAYAVTATYDGDDNLATYNEVATS